MDIYNHEESNDKEYIARDGKFYHNTPFWDTYEISEDEYNQWTRREEQIKKGYEENRISKKKYEELLTTLWYVDLPPARAYPWDLSGFADQYKIRLVEVLLRIAKPEISAPKEHSAQALQDTVNTTSEQIAQTLALSIPETFDIYKQNIQTLIAHYHEVVSHRWISDKEYSALLKLFLLGHVNDPVLFHAFESLKKEDTKYHFHRMFRYGFDNRDILPAELVNSETATVDDMSMQFITSELKDKNTISLSDLDESQEKIQEKIQRTFVKNTKEFLVWIKRGFAIHRDVYLRSLIPDIEDLYDTLDTEERWIVDKTLSEDVFFPDRAYWDSMLTYERNAIVELVNGWSDFSADYPWISTEKIISTRQYAEHANPHNAQNMQQCFWLTPSQLNQCIIDAKAWLVKDFLAYVENVTFDTMNKFDTIDPMNVIGVGNLAKTYHLICESAEYYNIDKNELTKKLQTCVYWLVEECMKKLINKEMVEYDKAPKGKGSMRSSYNQSLSEIERRLEWLYRLWYPKEKTRNSLSMSMPDSLKVWKEQQRWLVTLLDDDENLDKYRREYSAHHEGDFKENRIKSVIEKYNIDIDVDKEWLQKQLLPIIKDRIVEVGRKKVHQAKTTRGTPGLGLISKNNIFTIIKSNVLYHTWLLTLVKSVIVDDSERKQFWIETKRKAAEESIQELLKNLQDEKTADHVSYLLLDPLLQVFKTYGGKQKESHIRINHAQIDRNYLGYVRDHIWSEVSRKFGMIRWFIAGKSKKEAAKVYLYLDDATIYVTHFFLHHIAKIKKKASYKPLSQSRDIFEQNKQQYEWKYPGSYLIAISRLGHSLEEIEQMFPNDFIDACMKVFAEEEKLQHAFFEKLVPEWMQWNLWPWGKVQRMIEEKLLSNKSADPAAFSIQYISENVENIIIQDMQEVLYRWNQFPWAIQQIISSIVIKWLNQRKEKIWQKPLSTSSSKKLL